jgi:pimeloyl-ACP methyl ester carboxylesterase
MREKEPKRGVLVVCVPVALVAVLAASWSYLYPLESAELSQRFGLWHSGVERLELGGLKGYRRNHCPRTRSEENCTCVLLVHGLGDNALTWRKILTEPAKTWVEPVDLHAIDLPGSGESPPPADKADYRVRTLARRLGQALGKTPDCRKWMVVGNSFGGWLSAWLALEAPDRVRKLVLVDSAGLKGPTTESAKLLSEPTPESLKEFQRRAYHKGRDLPERVWRAAARRAAEGNSRDVVAAQVPDDYLDTHLPTIRKPTLVFWGESDKITPAENGRRIAAMVPGAAYRGANDCGHLPQKECPAPLLHALNEMVRFGAF